MREGLWIVLGAVLSCQSAPNARGTDNDEPTPQPTSGRAPDASPDPVTVIGTTSQDPPEAQAARKRLVRHIHAQGEPWQGSGPWNESVLAALGAVPRHQFMPGVSIPNSYADRPETIGYGQTISQPTVVAMMTQALDLTGTESVLEIGTGSGYQAAVLAKLVRKVYSIEIVEPLGRVAETRLAALGYSNVSVRIGDGYQGWPEHAPYDRIIVTAAPPKMPEALVAQLRDGGVMVAPVGVEVQRLVRWTKRAGKLDERDLGAVRFVPMVPGEGTD